jgi:hypothetical protein
MHAISIETSDCCTQCAICEFILSENIWWIVLDDFGK